MLALALSSVVAVGAPAWPASQISSHPPLETYSLEESCAILDQVSFASSAGLPTLSDLQGPGYAVRVLAKPRHKPFETYDVAILVGELHMKPCADAERGKSFLKEFQHFAFELYMAPPHEAGKALAPGLGPVGSNFEEAQKIYGLCGSIITQAGEEVVFHSAGQKKLYLLEGQDLEHPYNWRERIEITREEALMKFAYFLVQNFHLKPGNPAEPDVYRREVSAQSLRVPENVAEWEAVQRRSIEAYGKIQPRVGGLDIRNKVMAQNIGLILGRRYRNQYVDRERWAEPVVALMGSGHIAGVKHQLMLYQKFKEIPVEHLRSCALANAR